MFAPAYRYPAPPLPPGFTVPADAPPLRLQEMDLYVTMRCNIRCSFCNVRAGEYDHRDLSAGRIRSLLDEAAALGLKELNILGGEPALRRDLAAIVSHASRLRLHTRVITNGMLLSRQRIQRLIDAGLGQMMVSVDGMRHTHNRLRRAGDNGWDTTMRTVRECVELGLPTRVSTVAFRENFAEIAELMRYVESIGVSIFSVFLGSPLGRGHDRFDQTLDPAAWRRLQEQLAAAAASLRAGFAVVVEQGFSWPDGAAVDRSQIKGRGSGCSTLLDDFEYLIVRSDGNVYQCVFFMTEGAPIGCVAEQPLEPTLRYALQLAAYAPFTVAQDRCAGCLHQQRCGGGCRGYAYLASGDWLRTDPRCAKSDGSSAQAPPYFPLCPIMKLNLRTGLLAGSTEQALAPPESLAEVPP